MYAYNYAARNPYRVPAKMGAIDQSTIVKWVVVPGATVATLFVISRLIKGKKRRKK